MPYPLHLTYSLHLFFLSLQQALLLSFKPNKLSKLKGRSSDPPFVSSYINLNVQNNWGLPRNSKGSKASAVESALIK